MKIANLLVLALLVSFAAPMFGAVVIDFGTGSAGAGGTFNLLTGGNATGTNIPIGVMTVIGTSGMDGTYAVSGTCAGSGMSSVGCLNFDTQASTVSVVGGISALGLSTQTLLTGSFVSWVADNNGLTNAIGPDTKADTLLSSLGLSSPPLVFNYFGFSLAATGNGSVAISTDIKNTGVVPEPASMALIGIGLAGLALAGRRFRRN